MEGSRPRIDLIDCPKGIKVRFKIRVQPICSVTGYIDECEAIIEYLSDGRCLEIYSLLQYVLSYNRVTLTNEELADKIYRDLMEELNNQTLQVKVRCMYQNAVLEIEIP